MNVIVLAKESFLDHNENEFKMNPYDLFTLKKAIKLKELNNSKITVLSMGPTSTEVMLRTCLALGADHVYHLNDEAFVGADTFATSYVISKALALLLPFDLIFCGSQSTEGETGSVGPSVATWLNIPFYTSITDICRLENSRPVFEMTNSDCISYFSIREATGPAVLCYKYFDYDYITPSLFAIKKAAKSTIHHWDASTLEIEVNDCGLLGSKTKVLETENRKSKNHDNVSLKKENIVREFDATTLHILVDAINRNA